MKIKLAKLFNSYLDSINFEDKSIVEIIKTKDTKFGDYTSNISLKLTRTLGKAPMDIAEEIKNYIVSNYNDVCKDVTVTNPGFVNIFLSDKFIVENAIKFLDDNYKPDFDSVEKKKVLYEFISANPTGDLHIGHARNAVVGDIVIKTLRYLGHEVDAEYYINDGGNQIKILAESVYYYFAKFQGIETKLTKESVGYHGEEIQSYANKLIADGYKPEGETEEEKIKGMGEMSANHFLSVIKDLLVDMNITPIQMWASEKEHINSAVPNLFKKLEDMNATYVKDDATWIGVEKFGDEKDRVLIKNTGLYTYMVADLAYHMKKYERGYDLIIDLWGKDHHGYEPRIQAGLKAMGFENKLEVDYISMVQISNNGEIVKMSKRSGTSFRIKTALESMDIDVFRFFLVSKSKEQEMEIDINIATQQDLSNPYYYVQYVNARVAQIINKYLESNGSIDMNNAIDKLGLEEKEKSLMVKMNEFEDVILSVNSEREPSLLVNYLKELCQEFNSFYSAVKVISDDEELTKQRILLIVSMKNLLNTLFNLISIRPKDKV